MALEQAYELVHVGNCPRCGGVHAHITAQPLTRPTVAGGIAYTHWWTCPTHQEPVLTGRTQVVLA